MSNRKKIAFNTVSQIIGKILTTGTMVVVSILIARSLGAEGYGNFVKITTFVAFFYLLSDFGINTAYLELSDQKNAAGSLLVLRFVIGLVLMFLCVSILPFLPGDVIDGYTPLVKLCIILYSGTILFQSLITTGNAFFQKQLRYDLSTIASLTGSIATLVFVTTIYFTGTSSLLLFTFIGLCTYGIIAGISLFFAKKITPTLSFSFDHSLIKKYLFIAIPLGLTLLCNVVYFHADSIILTLFRTTSEVGVYGFAYKIFEFPLVIPTFFMNAVFPLLLLSRKSGDEKAFTRQMKLSGMILFFMSLIFTIVGFLISPYISLVNADFQLSIVPLRILLLSLPVFFLTSLTMWVLIALKKRKELFFIYFFSMVINIGSNIIFIPTFGYLASAWITVGSETLVLFLSGIVIQQHFRS